MDKLADMSKDNLQSCIRGFGSVALLLLVLFQLVYISAGRAEEPLVQAWVLCQPDSWINIRGSASKKGSYEGMLISGDVIWTDGQTQNGYMHCDNMTNEAGDGWVYEGYIVYSEPVEINSFCQITSKGRVACRRSIDGTRRKWVRNGDQVFVYSTSDEWSLTNVGFIQSQYIEISNTDSEMWRCGT